MYILVLYLMTQRELPPVPISVFSSAELDCMHLYQFFF